MSRATARLLREAAEVGMRHALHLETQPERAYRPCVWCGTPLDEAEVLRAVPGTHGFLFIAADCECGGRTCIPWPLPYGVDPEIGRGPQPIPVREPEPAAALATHARTGEGDL